MEEKQEDQQLTFRAISTCASGNETLGASTSRLFIADRCDLSWSSSAMSLKTGALSTSPQRQPIYSTVAPVCGAEMCCRRSWRISATSMSRCQVRIVVKVCIVKVSPTLVSDSKRRLVSCTTAVWDVRPTSTPLNNQKTALYCLGPVSAAAAVRQ